MDSRIMSGIYAILIIIVIIYAIAMYQFQTAKDRYEGLWRLTDKDCKEKYGQSFYVKCPFGYCWCCTGVYTDTILGRWIIHEDCV